MPYLLVLLVFLTGCASGSTTAELGRAWLQQSANPVDATAQGQGLDPRFRYLRVQVVGSVPALMALAFEDASVHGTVEVWFSGQGESLQTLGGRVVASHGLPTDWRRVTWPDGVPKLASLPVLSSAAPGEYAKPLGEYRRQRDVLPSHAHGQTERLVLSQLDWVHVPKAVRPNAGDATRFSHWRWFKERSQADAGAHIQAVPPLPAAWFAVGEHQGVRRVVYSFQCLAQDFCLRLQVWPWALPSPAPADRPSQAPTAPPKASAAALASPAAL